MSTLTFVPQVGDELKPFVRTTGFANWNRYAAVNDEFVPIHMDDEAGRAAGHPTAIGMGNLQWSYLHNALRAWLGTDGRIVKLSCQFRGVNTREQVVTARGTVTSVEPTPAGLLVELDVWTENQDGAILAPGKAVVEVAARG